MANEIKVQLHRVSASASEATIRSHQIRIDRPLAKGGTDAGPMGGELFLASLGGCFMSTLLAAIQARAMDVPNVATEVTGTLADPPSRFAAIHLRVTATGPTREDLEKLVQIADRSCIMMNTLRPLLALQIEIDTENL